MGEQNSQLKQMDPESAFFSLRPKEIKIIPGKMQTPALCV